MIGKAKTPPSRWAKTQPEDLPKMLQNVDCRWWVAGGWALDLFLGKQTRDHSDLEVGCFREDLPKLLSGLVGWEYHAARNKELHRLTTASDLTAEEHGIWAKQEGAELWTLEILVENQNNDLWYYRRAPEITKPVTELTFETKNRLMAIRPEIQLLYKAKEPREKDLQDFAEVLPQLEPAIRKWLHTAITTHHPASRALTKDFERLISE